MFQVGGCIGAILLGRMLDHRRTVPIVGACFVWAAAWIVVTAEAGTSVPLLITAMLALPAWGHRRAECVARAELGVLSDGHSRHRRRLGSRIGRIGSIVGPLIGGYLLTQAGGARQVLWAACIPALSRDAGPRCAIASASEEAMEPSLL